MKAAIMYHKGDTPKYSDFPDPTIQEDNELLISVKAAALKHLDKAQASGKHYSTENDKALAKVIGGDGVGLLANGTRVYAIGTRGMIAERAVIEKNYMVVVPDSLDDATAAALPNAVMGSAMALRFRAQIKPGETVLINGATSFTGKIAVQIAKHYGAKKIIVTGRNEDALQALLTLGADEIISVKQDDDAFLKQLKSIHQKTPVDVIIDYLWGHSVTLILAALKGQGSFTHKTRFVSIGAITGDIIELSAENLRSVDLQLSGSGLGSWTKVEVGTLFNEILPEMFNLAASGNLKVDTACVGLEDIEKLWSMSVVDGKRLVVII